MEATLCTEYSRKGNSKSQWLRKFQASLLLLVFEFSRRVCIFFGSYFLSKANLFYYFNYQICSFTFNMDENMKEDC